MKPLNVLALIMILSIGVPFVDGADFPRHIDPNLLAVDNPDPEALFNIYLNVFDAITTSDFDAAESILASIEDIGALPYADKALEQYNQLLRSVIADLNQTETSLQTAYNHLDWRRELRANDSLRAASSLLVSSNSSSQNMGDDSHTLASVLSGSPAALLESKEKLDDFIEELNQEILDGFQMVDSIAFARIEGLQETVLTLSCNSFKPWVGSEIRVSGNLTTLEGSPLNGKTIEVQLAYQILSVVSDESGGFTQSLAVPYNYVDSLEMAATYWPSSEDFSSYTPTVTSLTLETTFFTPVLSLELPEKVYPGGQYQATGRVQHLGMPLNVNLSLVGFGSSFFSQRVSDGVYVFYMNIPTTAKTGGNKVTLRSESLDIYGPSSLVEVLDVVRLPIILDLDCRDFIISGQSAEISGTVRTNSHPVGNCTVEVQLGETKLKTVTDESGTFTTTFPQDVFLLSLRRAFTVEATPQEPWISGILISDSIIMLNAVSLLTLPIMLIVLIVARRTRTSPTIFVPVIQQTPQAPYPYPEHTGLAGVYVKGVRYIERITGQYLGPSSTIQEYLSKVKPLVADPIYRLFRQLSSIFERWIYGPKEANEPVNISENLLDQMIDE